MSSDYLSQSPPTLNDGRHQYRFCLKWSNTLIISYRSSVIKSNQRPRITVQEWAVCGFASLTLAFTAWGFGGVIAWTVHIMLAGAALTFLAALWPRKNSGSAGASRAAPISLKAKSKKSGKKTAPTTILDPQFLIFNASLNKLLRWPLFWFSFLFLVYLTIQAFNPSIAVVHGEGGWWVEQMIPPLAKWLPTSVQSDYEPMNAFRVLEWFSASFILMWGIWTGITRRKTILIILWSLIVGGTAMAMVGILQDLTDADKVLWSMKSANPQFWGSFFYRNQGAAYLNLTLIGAGVLYFYHAKKAEESAQSSGPHFLLFIFFALVVVSVALALSRGGILFAAILSIAFVVGVIFQALRSTRRIGGALSTSLILLVLLSSGAYLMIQQIDLSAIQARFGDVGATIENAEKDSRLVSSKATLDMAKDRAFVGWGAGSFRYIFPIYQQKYPEIFHSMLHKKQGWIGRQVYHYAHNDILQFWAEYGTIGCGLLFLTFASLIFPVLKNAFHFPLSTFHLVVGLACVSAHAFIDFILNSPAYWIALVGLLTGVLKLFQLEKLLSIRLKT